MIFSDFSDTDKVIHRSRLSKCRGNLSGVQKIFAKSSWLPLSKTGASTTGTWPKSKRKQINAMPSCCAGKMKTAKFVQHPPTLTLPMLYIFL